MRIARSGSTPPGPGGEFERRAAEPLLGSGQGIDHFIVETQDFAVRLEPDEGLFGKSVLVPPEFAHGIWLELFERPRSGE